MVLQKSRMMDCKSMENSHDDRSEEVERLDPVDPSLYQ
jgi:hypothetical protein